MPKFRSKPLGDNAPTGIAADRRSRRRYPMDLPLQYKLLRNQVVFASGTGRVLNISSKGLVFESNAHFEPGMFLELSVRWPVLLNRSCPLKLVASGRVTRCDGHSAAIDLERYEFRTAGSGHLADVPPAPITSTVP